MIIDVPNPQRINRVPDRVKLLSSDNFSEQGFQIIKAELRLYIQNTDERLGPYSVITSFIETNKGQIEMLYDEGYRGENSLERAATFLGTHLGLSGVILRSLIALQESGSH